MWILIIALVLTIFAGHPESVLHVVFVGVLYGLSLKPNLRAIALALFAGLAALLLAAVYLMPFAEAAPLTVEYRIRKDHYAKASYDELVQAQLDNAKGDGDLQSLVGSGDTWTIS